MIRILLVSNSAVDKGLLQNTLGKHAQFHIVKSVNNDIHELQTLKASERPDVILVVEQSNFPCNKEGVRYLHKLFDVPIIICTSEQEAFVNLSNAIVLPKITLRPTSDEFEFWLNELTALILKAAQNKSLGRLTAKIPKAPRSASLKAASGPHKRRIDIIAIGASTGGPQTLNAFLALLPSNLPVPVVIVQHMPVNFLSVLIGWLQNECPLPIEIARDGTSPLPGHVYFAPDQFHLTLDEQKKFKLVDAPPLHNVKPSASYLFKSVAQVYGNRALGIILTGMGKDGAQELGLIKAQGGITFAQNKETSIIFGMPKEAVRLNAALFVLSPAEIARKLQEFI